MCVGTEDPLLKPVQLLFAILLIVLIYVLYRVLARKYPDKRGGLKSVAVTLSVLIALVTTVLMFTGSFC